MVIQRLGALILWVLVLASGVLLVYLRHENRETFSRVHALEAQRDQLYQEWTQLLLEQSTLSSYPRVDFLASTRLQMRHAKPEETVMVVVDLHESH
jgi:cell division protein FtsL